MLDKKQIDTALKEYDVTEAAIGKLKEDYLPLTIEDVDDKEAYTKVKVARKVVRDLRMDVEKKRKLLKEDSLVYGRAIDKEAKRITEDLRPIEEHLDFWVKYVDDEKEKRRKEKEEAEMKVAQDKIDELTKFDCHLTFADAKVITDDHYQAMLSKAKADFEVAEKEAAEAQKEADEAQAAEDAEKKKEEAKLEKQRKEQGEKQAELDEQKAEQELKDEEQTAKEENLEKREEKVEEKEVAAEEAGVTLEEKFDEFFLNYLKAIEDANARKAEDLKIEFFTYLKQITNG